MFTKKLGTYKYVPGTSTSIIYHNGDFLYWKKSAERGLSQLDRMCAMWTVSLRHAASDTAAVRPALRMGGRGGSGVDIVVVAPGTSSSVGRVLGNRYVEGRRN